MRNVCLFLQSKNSCSTIQWTLGKNFLPPTGCGSVFPAKSYQDTWRSGNLLPSGQLNMADETKLHSPIHSTWSTGCVTWGQVLSWRRSGTFLLTSASCRHCNFWFISLICWAYFSDVMVSLGFRKPYWIKPAVGHQWLWSFLGSKFGFGKCFGASSRSNHWVGCCQLSHKIHFLSHVIIQLRNGSLLLHRIREAETLKWWFFFFFWFAVSSWGTTHLSSLFTFLICFKCQMTREWLILSSSATSHVVEEDQLRWSSQLVVVNSDGQPLCSSSSKLSSPLQNFLTYPYTVCLLAVPGPNAFCWGCELSVLLSDPLWTRTLKKNNH